MNRRRAVLAAWIVGGLALAGGAGLALRQFATGGPGAAADAFFEQTYRDLDGQTRSMAQWKGRLIVVNFWATWCAPCVEEMPDLQRVHDEYSDRGVSVVGLGIDSPSALRRFRDEHRLSLPLFAAGTAGSELSRTLGNPSGALPFTVVVDQKGRIVRSHLGQLRPVQIRAWLDAQLGSAAR